MRRAEAQIKALFARSQVRVFPPPGPERDDNFFSRTIPDPDQARLYVGLSAPGRNLKGVLLRSYLGLMAAAQKAWNDHKGMGATNPADPYMTLLGYFSNLKELGVTRSILEDELGAQLEQFARNRPSPWRVSRIPSPAAGGPDEPEELTSRVNTAKISSTKDRLSKPYVDKDHLDVALATNMISVGLDISRLGLMVVLNQPKTAAEYIQATSRVGRQLEREPGAEQTRPGAGAAQPQPPAGSLPLRAVPLLAPDLLPPCGGHQLHALRQPGSRSRPAGRGGGDGPPRRSSPGWRQGRHGRRSPAAHQGPDRQGAAGALHRHRCRR